MFALFESGESIKNSEGEFHPSELHFFPVDEGAKTVIPEFDEHPDTIHQAKVYGVITGPRMRLHAIGDIYEHLIQKAQYSIAIGNMYFFPRQSIFESILQAVNRSVDFTLVTNPSHEAFGLCNSTRDFYTHLNRLNYFPLMAGKHFNFWELSEALDVEANKASIYELDTDEILYHKKIMTVDHLYSVIGSYNLGMKSEDADYEVAVIIESPEIAAQMETILHEDQARSKNISMTQSRGWYFNPFYNIAESFEKKFLDGIIL